MDQLQAIERAESLRDRQREIGPTVEQVTRIRDGVQQALGRYMGSAVLPAIAQHQQVLDQMAAEYSQLPGDFADTAAHNLRIAAASVAEQVPAMVEQEFDPRSDPPEFRFPAWERAVQQTSGYGLNFFSRGAPQLNERQQQLLGEYQSSVQRLRTAFTPKGVQDLVGNQMRSEFGDQ